MREIRMLRAMRRELETGLRWLLHGHERGNPAATAKELPTDYRASSRPYRGRNVDDENATVSLAKIIRPMLPPVGSVA